MITVTEEAKELFTTVEHPEGTILRLDPVTDESTGETQIGLSAGEPQGDDQVIEHDGVSLLHIAGPVSEALDGSTLNLVETPEGPALGLTTPDERPPSTDPPEAVGGAERAVDRLRDYHEGRGDLELPARASPRPAPHISVARTTVERPRARPSS